jgi:phage terminase small subunit
MDVNPFEVKPKGLTGKEYKFCLAYVADDNGTKAAKTAGYSEKTAGVTAHKLLKKTKIQACLAQMQAHLAKKFEITAERVLEEIALAAFLNPRDLFTESGNVKPINELPPQVMKCIKSINVRHIAGNDEVAAQVMKITLLDKGDMLEKLMRYLNLYSDDNSRRLDVDGLDQLLDEIDGKSRGIPFKDKEQPKQLKH